MQTDYIFGTCSLKTKKILHIFLNSNKDTDLIDVQDTDFIDVWDKNRLVRHFKLDFINSKCKLKGKNKF